MADLELKPCPFCGAPAELGDAAESGPLPGGEMEGYYVGCSECDTTMGLYRPFTSAEEAAAHWNQRQTEWQAVEALGVAYATLRDALQKVSPQRVETK